MHYLSTTARRAISLILELSGDVIVTSTAYFIGNCDIKGTLTVVGILAVSKTV